MKLYGRHRAWLALILTVAAFSSVNFYFLSPYDETGDGAGHLHAWEIHRLDHHDVGEAHRPVDDSTDVQRLTTQRARTDQTARGLRSGLKCPNLTIAFPVDEADTFQSIAGTSTFVYSAFLDKDRVRIIVLRKRSDPRSFYCHLWTDMIGVKEKDNLSITRGLVFTIPEDHDREYLASYIVCDVPSQLMNHPPFAVSVVFKEKCAQPTNRLPVNPPRTQDFNFTVCVTPLNRFFSQTHMFVEMIEFNRLLGADRFVFYNYSIHPDMGKILHHYRDLGLVELHQWPTSLPTQAHYFGQLASLNDCLYRYKTRSRYIVFQDLDEFLVPTGDQRNWSDLIESRLKRHPQTAVFQARCTFFRKEWPKLYDRFPRNDEVMKYQSVVLGHTLREGTILHHGHRSKYIIIPGLVQTAGIHEVWSSSGPTDKLEADVALLYHYRDWENPNDTQKRVEDTFVVRKYGQDLIGRLAKAWDAIQSGTGLV